MALTRTKLTGGKLYGSRAKAFQVILQGRNPVRWDMTGRPIEWTKELVAEFAFHAGEYTFHNQLTDGPDTGAIIYGHAFDSIAQGEQKGWTQEEHDAVVARIDELCEQQPGEVWQITAPKFEKPWPKYDDSHHNQVAVLAEQLGLVAESLAYERQNASRPSVIAKLEELLSAKETEEELTAA